MNPEMTAAFENGDLVKELVVDIDENVKPEPNRNGCCVFRVPKKIRSVKEKLYTPELISIGPLHHGKPELADMEMKKKQFMKSFLQRTTTEKIDKIFSYIKDNEERIRACYAETSTLGSPEFVKMIFYDSIFIMETFLRKMFQGGSDTDILPIMWYSLWIDLQLFENQLPYFILEDTYKLAFSDTDLPTFMNLSIDFFDDFMGVKLSRITPEVEVKHFTDWRRISLLEGYPPASAKKMHYDLPCAIKLHESGIKFKGITKKERSLFDIKFEKRKRLIPFFEVHELQMPQLGIGDETEFLLRNIIALEQCIYPGDDLVCNYIELMDSLINTVKDVDLLVENQIISNQMGDNVSVATMFNALGQNVIISTSAYHNLCKELKKHYNSPWNRAKATLNRVYFSNPWRGTATVAAIILLFLTVIQTVFSIWQVV